MIGTQWYSEDMEDATGVAPDGSGGSAGSEEVNVRRRGLGHRTLAKVLGEDNPVEFRARVQARRGNRQIWLKGLTQ